MEKVNDGILVEEVWKNSSPKILFLLKESTKRSGWSDIAGSRINVRCGDNPRFWPNVIRWKHAIFGACREGVVPEFPDLEETYEYRDNDGMLDEIAYVNVKKELGEVRSDDKAIARIALENKEALASQIDSISPEIVFCCYTFRAYKNIYKTEQTVKLANGLHAHRDRIIIDFYHPTNRTEYRDLYDKLSEILRQKEFPISRWR